MESHWRLNGTMLYTNIFSCERASEFINSNTQDLTKVDLDSVLLSQAETKCAQRKFNVKSFVARLSHVLKIEYIRYWHDYCFISRGYFLLRNDKRKLNKLTKFWQLWKLWWNSKSILVNVRSKIVLISKDIIFNQCFRFWKQRVLFISKKQKFEQLKQEDTLQSLYKDGIVCSRSFKAISFGKKDMKLRQVKQRLEIVSGIGDSGFNSVKLKGDSGFNSVKLK